MFVKSWSFVLLGFFALCVLLGIASTVPQGVVAGKKLRSSLLIRQTSPDTSFLTNSAFAHDLTASVPLTTPTPAVLPDMEPRPIYDSISCGTRSRYVGTNNYNASAGPSTMRVQSVSGQQTDFPVPSLPAPGNYVVNCSVCLGYSFPITITVDVFNDVMESNEGNNVYVIPISPTPLPTGTMCPLTPTSTATMTSAPSSTRTATPTPTFCPSCPTSTPTPSCSLAWSLRSSPNPSTANFLQDVVAISANDVWAVGFTGASYETMQTLITHWDGTQWNVVPSPNIGSGNYLQKVDAVSWHDIWAVGYYEGVDVTRTLTLHWNGIDWSVVPTLNETGSGYLYGVSAAATNDVWAVGFQTPSAYGYALILHWNGNVWSVSPLPIIPGNFTYLLSVDVATANDVWAVGTYTAGTYTSTLVLHWNGMQWSIVSSPNSGINTNYQNSVTVLSSNDVWAAGYGSPGSGPAETLIEHWDGVQWDIVPSPNIGHYNNQLESIIASPGNIWAVGHYETGIGTQTSQTLALKWNGESWDIQPSLNTGTEANILTGIAVASFGDIWAVGTHGAFESSQTLVERYTGPCTTPTPLTTFTPTYTPSPINTFPASITVTATPVSNGTSLPTQCAIVFSDVPNENAFNQYVRCLACRGIVSGYADGTFRPGNDITRGQIAKIVSIAAGYSEDPGPQLYEDVAMGSPFYDWINRLSNRGIMGGYPCGLVPEEPCISHNELPYFRPNASATRGQLAKIVSNAADLITTPTGVFYTDVPEGHPFYVWIMRLTSTLEAISGYNCGGVEEPCDNENRPYFRPFNNVTRGQASKIIAISFLPNCQAP